MKKTDTNSDNASRGTDVKIAPSLLAADFMRLGEEIASVSAADMLHIDVMDGHFVPNITFGPGVVEAIGKFTDQPLDVHLMIADPDRYVEDFVKAGATTLTLSAEACIHLHRSVGLVKALGVRVGVALNPATPLDVVEYILEDLAQLLIMAVNPGFGGQKFIPGMVSKIRALRRIIMERKLQVDIQVDGGIDLVSAPLVVEAGANMLVAGSSIFRSAHRDRTIADLRFACQGNQ